MALGVLNNLSAIYAENNLNNTNNSLQTVLEQLSSGSKINSGAGEWPGGQPDGTDAVGDQCHGGRRLAAGSRRRAFASDEPAGPGYYAGNRSLERHTQLHAGRCCEPGVPVDTGRGQQHRIDDHLQPGAGV